MGTKYFTLGQPENNTLVKIIRIIFGIVCISIAVFWIVFNISSLKRDGTVWITIVFLTCFGLFQIWSGLGKAVRYIEIGSDIIILKKNAVLPAKQIAATEISKVEFRPLTATFKMKSEKSILLRFGATFYDINELIIDELLDYCELKNINYEVIEEKI
jgi:hypothetical protein